MGHLIIFIDLMEEILEKDKIIFITNRFLCPEELTKRVEFLCLNGIKTFILREKDLSFKEYLDLAKDIIEITNSFNAETILHSFIEVARELNHKKIHLPMESLIKNHKKIKDFDIIGASAHSVEDAVIAKKLGANYITLSHIYKTDCKPGLEPRGLELIRDTIKTVDIDIYGLGGIKFSNMENVINVGAKKVCIMSELCNTPTIRM